MSTVKITVENGNVAVSSPYNNDFIQSARQLGGKWKNSAWNFSQKDESRVRELCMSVYGTDGSPMPIGTIRIKLDELSLDDELIVGPVQVLKKFNRDSTPKLGNDCVVISGKLQSYGGSARYPRITHDDNTVIEARNVPQTIINQLVEDDPDAYSIVSNDEKADELTAEEKSLLVALQALTDERRQMILAQLS